MLQYTVCKNANASGLKSFLQSHSDLSILGHLAELLSCLHPVDGNDEQGYK